MQSLTKDNFENWLNSATVEIAESENEYRILTDYENCIQVDSDLVVVLENTSKIIFDLDQHNAIFEKVNDFKESQKDYYDLPEEEQKRLSREENIFRANHRTL